MNKTDKFPLQHRDINWLSFNDRVLQEAADESNPLYERLKFIAIFSSNLDEYFRVRVSQLRQLKRVDKSIRKKLALRPSKFVKQLLVKVAAQQEELGTIFFDQIVPELKENNIHLMDFETLQGKYEKLAQKYYLDQLKKSLHIDIVEASKSSEIFLENQHLYYLVTFENEQEYGIVNIPSSDHERFIELAQEKETHFIAFLDDLIKLNLLDLFPDKEITNCYEIKLSRDAELYLDQELEGTLADLIHESLSQRDKGQATRLLYDKRMPKKVKKNLRKSLGLGKIDMVAGGTYHNFDDFFSFPDPTKNKQLHAAPLKVIKHKALENATSYFDLISEKDQLVHFPFMSFDYVQNFIDQASQDDAVEEIKISLYRVADESALTDALLRALKNGKKVTVFVEAKARFDEENNIKWGRIFEEHGARVIYSYPRIKVHSKVLLVLRNENGKLKRYAYIGTGNFNAKTSKIYCDHGLFTAHKKITKDLLRTFKVLQGELIIPRASHLLISPFTTRSTIESLIRREIELADTGKGGFITAKMNQLEDPGMIKLLYKASQAGVKIKLIVRGFSRLIPQLTGISENIEMTSIVDRFLEHGRIYKFHNDGDPIMYTGSADWMSRNLDRRIEVLTPVYDQDIFKELDDILNIQLQDNVKARLHTPEEDNPKVQATTDQKKIRSQVEIYNYLLEKHK
ncbi:polyphosphate kinase [Nonlabens dokdonensis]|jgi:polyphosphate kinase|uniref:Polyphosphate kinase n=2 Tax=Nonlabens dokdonensis TaxID=328515 RepID=L7WHF4_NONDD|nr:polyphosphate kinase 1 [Nonlabens dokdonensis]AGC78408.1 polyphosphate kinase [Nonlabens dokdonensis DSW-6]PZX38156.1 polyphosphate kinase [Nonlabens dokdonensis]